MINDRLSFNGEINSSFDAQDLARNSNGELYYVSLENEQSVFKRPFIMFGRICLTEKISETELIAPAILFEGVILDPKLGDPDSRLEHRMSEILRINMFKKGHERITLLKHMGAIGFSEGLDIK